MIALVGNHEELLIAVVGSLAVVIAAAVPTLIVFLGRRTKVATNGFSQLEERHDVLIDLTHQHGERIDYIAHRIEAHIAKAEPQLDTLVATGHSVNTILDELGLRLLSLEERVALLDTTLHDHMDRAEPYLARAEGYMDIVDRLLKKEEK